MPKSMFFSDVVSSGRTQPKLSRSCGASKEHACVSNPRIPPIVQRWWSGEPAFLPFPTTRHGIWGWSCALFRTAFMNNLARAGLGATARHNRQYFRCCSFRCCCISLVLAASKYCFPSPPRNFHKLLPLPKALPSPGVLAKYPLRFSGAYYGREAAADANGSSIYSEAPRLLPRR